MSQTPEFILGDEFAKVLTETTMSLVCVLDRDGRIRLFNDACERVTGFSRDEVIGGDARDFVIPPKRWRHSARCSPTSGAPGSPARRSVTGSPRTGSES